MEMEESLESMLDKLKVEAKPWDIATHLEKGLIEAFRVDEQVDIIYGTLVSQGLGESDVRKYLKKVDDICTRIEKEVPNIRELPHRKRGKVIFDKLRGKTIFHRLLGKRFLINPCGEKYKLTEVLDDGVGNCNSLSALVGGIMQRFGLKVIFQQYIGPRRTHVNIGLICEDEEGKPIITVESTHPEGYDFADYEEYAKSKHNLRFNSNYDSRVLSASNITERSISELKANKSIAALYSLKMNLMAQEFVPDYLASLFNIALEMYKIKINPKTNIPIELDVELMIGLLERLLEINPKDTESVGFLSLVKSQWG